MTRASLRLAEDAATLLASALREARLAETSARASHWLSHADAYHAILAAAYRPLSKEPLRAFLNQVAPMADCEIVEKRHA